MLMAALLTGCVSSLHGQTLTETFNPKTAAFINESGPARISGQAFVRQGSGKLHRAIGTDVRLIPRNAYADERIAAIYGDDKQQRWAGHVPDADPRYLGLMRTTIASSSGSFSFDNVADGEYYIIAMVFRPGEYRGHEYPIMERVTVKGGKNVKVVMRGY